MRHFTNLLLSISAFFILNTAAAQDRRLAVIGSSTAAGLGPSSIDSSFVKRLNYYYKYQLGVMDSTYNLAVSGTTCYNGMPTGYTSPASRPGYDTSKNVSKALSLLSGLNMPSKGVVIISFPTNGYDVFTVDEIMLCLQTIYNAAISNGNTCYVTTTQPRSDGNFANSATKRKLAVIKDSILNRFGNYALNFWDGIFNPLDTTISAAYSAGDNVHLNSAGHRVLYERVVAKNIFNMAANEYRSNVNPAGAWTNASSWQVFNGTSWVSAAAAPDSNAAAIHILAGDSIYAGSGVNMDQVSVYQGGVLSVFNTSTPFTATLNNGAGTDLDVSGRLYVSVNGTLTGAGTLRINSTGQVILRNQGVLSVSTTNNGNVTVSGTGNIRNTTFFNNKTFVLSDFTLNLNNSSFTNNDSFVINYNATSYIAATVSTDSGTFINNASGIIYRSNTAGITNFNGMIKVYNYGRIKGFGEYAFYNAMVNSGEIDPGNYSAAILTVNPAFITGKNPSLLLQIHSTGNVAGTNYDQLRFSTVNTLNTIITGATLKVIDQGADPVSATYTLVSATGAGTITGPFSQTYQGGNFSNAVYSSNAVSITKLGPAKTWDGGAGTSNWNDAANWNNDMLPAITDYIVINTSAIINVNTTATINGMSLNHAQAAVSVSPGNSLTINGLLMLEAGLIQINGQSLVLNGQTSSGKGTITGSAASSLTIGGSAGGNFGTLNMTPYPANVLGNLIINRSGTAGSVSIGNNGLEIAGTVTLDNGTLNTNGNLTLQSKASGTARVSVVTNGIISGAVTVQRYIPGGANHRRWRFLASPAGNVSLSSSWQDSIHITGPGTGGSPCPSLSKHSNGFDATSSNAVSMYTYNEAGNAWAEITGTNNTLLESGKGYRVFIRGSRADGCTLLTTMPSSTSNVTLKAKGTLTTGTKKIPLTRTGTNGWNLVGNPYPSAVSWGNAQWQLNMSLNIDRSIHVYNPVTNTYSSWHPVAGGINGGTGIIAFGQAFFINAFATDTLTFQEVYKSSDSVTGIFGKMAEQNKLLIKVSDSLNINEAVVYAYSGADGNLQPLLDGHKPEFEEAHVGSFTPLDSTLLSFNAFAQDTVTYGTDTVLLSVNGFMGSYKMLFRGVNSFNRQLTLVDRMQGIAILLMSDTMVSVTATGTSSDRNRFLLIFSQSASVPAKLISFKASLQQQGQVLVSWQTASEKNTSHFVVEKSSDGNAFTPLATLAATGHSNNFTSYRLTDNEPYNTLTYYRLRTVDLNRDFSFSHTEVVQLAGKNAMVTVYPNPSSGPVTLTFNNLIALTVKLYDPSGKIIFEKNISAGSDVLTLNENVLAASGIYVLELISEKGIHTYRILRK